MVPPSTEGFVELGGVRLEYRHVGPPPATAPTIVMLHEGLGCVSTWRDFPDRLSDATGHGVFVYSRQGYGGSSPCALPRPLDYMQHDGCEVVPRLLDAIDFREGTLFGHSDGASIAAVYAGHHPDDARVKALVLMAPHFFTEPVGLASIAASKRAYETGDLRERLRRHHGDNVDCAFRGWNDAWSDPGFVAWNIESYLPPIAIPVLALQGADDPYGSDRQVQVVAEKAAGPVDVVLLPDCRHAPYKEQPDASLAAIAGFVTRVFGR